MATDRRPEVATTGISRRKRWARRARRACLVVFIAAAVVSSAIAAACWSRMRDGPAHWDYLLVFGRRNSYGVTVLLSRDIELDVFTNWPANLWPTLVSDTP